MADLPVLGTSLETIKICEDRELFRSRMEKEGIPVPHGVSVHSLEEALDRLESLSFPLMLRLGFSLGGLGSGLVYSRDEFISLIQNALRFSDTVQMEESLKDWGEFEFEVLRDQFGHGLVICGMENIDPMGIHTGDSLVVAPTQTLNNTEYFKLRALSLSIADHLNIIGECNIQFAVHPQTREIRVIEVNPRLSRSSALASKATGYPLAWMAAKLALGENLCDLKHPFFENCPAFIEPAMDYLVVKIPRWDFDKFPGVDRRLGTQMKSVGESMGIGRNFKEALQKALAGLGIGIHCLADQDIQIPSLEAELKQPSEKRLFALLQFFRQEGSLSQAKTWTGIHPFFLEQLKSLAEDMNKLASRYLTDGVLLQAKKSGFSDRGIARLKQMTEAEIYARRQEAHIYPWIKCIDGLAGERPEKSPYHYLTYHGELHEVEPLKGAVMLLGSGPYRIGASVEFDWALVNALRTLKKIGTPTLLINNNPETVSTDGDESLRCYLEPLTEERVLDILKLENFPPGICCFGASYLTQKDKNLNLA